MVSIPLNSVKISISSSRPTGWDGWCYILYRHWLRIVM